MLPGHLIWQEEPSHLDTLIGDTPVPASRLLLLLAHTANCFYRVDLGLRKEASPLTSLQKTINLVYCQKKQKSLRI